MKKQLHLEGLRGIAALIVVLSHFAAIFYPSTNFGAQYPAHEDWESLFTTTPLALVFAGHFAVCLFFLLSGYVLSLPYFGNTTKDTNHLLAALIKRPFRLSGLVLTSILVSFCLDRLSWYFNAPVSIQTYSTPWFESYWSQNTVTLDRLIIDVVTRLFSAGFSYNQPLWTIKIELYGSFLTFIFLLFFRGSNLRLLAYLYTFVLFHGTLYHGFIIGIFLADIVRNYPHVVLKLTRTTLAWPLLFVGLLLSSRPEYITADELESTFFGSFPSLRGLGGGYSMLGATIVFIAVLISPNLQKMLSVRIFVLLGKISFALYAFHFLILGSFTSWLFLKLSPLFTYNINCAVVGITSITVMFVLSYWLTKYVDEPTTRIANRMAIIWLNSTNKITCPSETRLR